VFLMMPHAQQIDEIKDGEIVKYSWHSGPDVVEYTFWGCMVVQVVYETHQMVSFSSWSAYLQGSGNTYDFVININLIFALLCRVGSSLIASNEELQGKALCDTTHACDVYIAMEASLAITLLIYIFRMLYAFSAHRRLGVLSIIVQKIASDDVAPFMIYCAIVIFNFEVTLALRPLDGAPLICSSVHAVFGPLR
jgi:hypothetical protein